MRKLMMNQYFIILKINRVLILIIFSINSLYSNNIQISNVQLTDHNTIEDYIYVQFDISWENSWRTNTGTKNWDAVWVFIKYREKNNINWSHALLNYVDGTGSGDGHIAPATCSISSSNDNGNGCSYGVFIHRSSNGIGTFSQQAVQLRWNYGINGLNPVDSVEISVMGIEMVYIPQDSFYLGSGGSEFSAFYKYPNISNPYLVSSESAINVGQTNDYLYYSASNLYSGDRSGPIPNEFPKGFRSFYCMKYEITQGQYVAFLNKLTRSQQANRVATPITIGISSITNRYVMSNTSSISYRNGIRCNQVISSDDPVEFYCDYNGNDIPDENSDGQNIACNFLGWADFCAYIDWAALRPMTELEFEKLSRGSQLPIANEYAWGNSTIAYVTSLINPGLDNEMPLNSSANSNYGNSVLGPIRVGCFGFGVNSRTNTGAGYYGVMGLSGNLLERTISVGNTYGRGFLGNNGDGILDNLGNSNTTSWPSVLNGSGAGARGGLFNSPSYYCQISDRSHGTRAAVARDLTTGGRGVRFSPL